MTASSTWRRRLARAVPSRRVPIVLDELPAHPVEAWPAMLATAFHGADFVADARDRLIPVLETLHGRGLRIFDGDRARRAFATLPARVEVFRGTCEAEHQSGRYGVSWALDAGAAGGFALRHEIARYATRDRSDIATQLVRDGFTSDSIVLRACIHREHIVGLLLRRHEHEVIVLPEHLNDISVAPNPVSIDDYCEDPS